MRREDGPENASRYSKIQKIIQSRELLSSLHFSALKQRVWTPLLDSIRLNESCSSKRRKKKG